MVRNGAGLLVAASAALLAAGCASRPAPPPDAPYVLVLGTAQDGGLPQIASDHPRDRAARADPSRRRFVASILVVDPRSGSRWLVDATPDIREQVELARGHPRRRAGPAGGRPPLFDGIFLTHAHVGHYTGLVHLGREAYAARGQPVLGSARMIRFLETNGPWDLLVRLGHVELRELSPGVPVRLAADLTVTPLVVPHRSEYTDTLAFVVRGPSRSLLYLPDIDKWERWDRRIEDVLADVDVALLDGTFYADGEIPGRAMADIPHPFIQESLERFAALPPSERRKVLFTHLNHTNPAADQGGSEERRIEAAGMAVARDGMILRL